MPTTTKTTTMNEVEIREAIAAYLLGLPDGFVVDIADIILTDDDDCPIDFRVWAKIDH